MFSVYTLTFNTKNRIFLKECTYVFRVSPTIHSFCYPAHRAVCEMRTKALNIGLLSIHCFLPYSAMTQVVSHRLSPWRSGFDPGSVRVRFVVDKVALRQVVLRVLRFSPVIIPPVFHTHHLNVTLNRRTIGRRLEPSNKAELSRISESIEQNSTFRLFLQIFKLLSVLL